MKRYRVLRWSGTLLFWASPALAADALKFGPPPAWVTPQAIPALGQPISDRPVALLLTDQQIRIDAGKVVTFSELAMKIQKPEGLAAGNISIPWNPATDTITVNRLEIHRGDKVIDVLAAGQKFTTMRRESGLEEAMLDGVLTANIQPEGLQEGDTLVIATTTEHADPVLGRHVEASFADWPPLPIGAAHVHIDWPSTLKLRTQTKGPIPAKSATHGDRSLIEVSATDVQPIVPPKGAPPRFAISRLGEATDFASWGDIAGLMSPLYRKAAAIPNSGPLHDEVEKIRTSTADPKLRAEQALHLVQDRVRYVAMLMGQGGYVPADAETTWSRRFADCKGKTALLLGILHSLGIEAEPLLVQTRMGDAIAERLPMLSYFDHVLVRARLGSKTYFLDGTRTGDSNLDEIQIPDFGWALPVVADAKLIHLVSAPSATPQFATDVDIDASRGIYSSAPTTATQTITGDFAVMLQSRLATLSEAQQRQFFEEYWKKQFDFVTYTSSRTSFDRLRRELRLSMTGEAKLDWSTGFFHVPNSTVGYNPDFERTAGSVQDAPYAVGYPVFTKSQIHIHLPAAFTLGREAGTADVHANLAGVEYTRMSTVQGNVLTVQITERSLVPEISAKEAREAAPRLRALADEDVAVPLTARYRPTAADLAALGASEPGSAKEYFRRGLNFLLAAAYDKAIADFTKAHELDPSDIWPLANRGIARVMKNDIALAEADLQEVERKQPDNAVLLRSRGLLAEKRQDWAKAIDFYSKSLGSDPGNSFAYAHKAGCEAWLSKDEEALADSASALKADPTLMDLRVMRANIFVRRALSDDVAKEAELLTRENPNSDYAYVAAGKIYARLKRAAEAMKAFDHALAIKTSAFVYINRAQTRPFSDKAGRLADLDAALKLEPSNPDALTEKAEELAVDGDLKGAKQIYDGLANSKPENSYFTMRRAILAFKLGDTNEAAKILARVHADAKSASDFNSLCWERATAGIFLETALAECREALKRQPDTPAYLDSLALVELRMGDVDAAITDYNRAISKNSYSSYFGRALAYARKGDRSHAAADLAQGLKYDPDGQTRFEEYGFKFDLPQANGIAQALTH